VQSRQDEILAAIGEHIWITVASMVVGTLMAFALALAVRRLRRIENPVLGVSTVLYTIPSLALFSLLLPIFGLSSRRSSSGCALADHPGARC
jgi:osmoprotectant transport system permease protein